MEKLAQQIALRLRPGTPLCLWGDLGAGKTTFSRYVLKALDSSLEEIPSPTFSIVQYYSTLIGDVWHCDFYRLRHAEEIFELGMDEAFYTGICLVEWPEKAEPYLPLNRIDLHIEIGSNTQREITLYLRGSASDTFSNINI